MDKKYVFKIIKPLIPRYLVAIFFGFLLNFTVLVTAYFSQLLIDRVLPSKKNHILFFFLIGYMVIYVLRNCISFIKNVLFSKHGYKILCDIRDDIFSKIISNFNFTCFSSEKQGYIITLFRDWLTSISWFLSNILLNTITDCIFLVISMTILAISDLRIFIAILITLPLYGFIYIFFNPKIQKSRKKMIEKDVDITQNLKDALDSIKEIRTLNAEDIVLQKYNNSQTDFRTHGLKYVIITYVYDSITNIASAIGHVIVFALGGLAVFNGEMTIGSLIALNAIVAFLYTPVEKIVTFNRLLQSFKIEFNKLTDFLLKNIDIKENNIMSSVDYLPNIESKENIILKLKNISFTYDTLSVLEDVNLEFSKGRTYAIVGENGSGKSTLINIVMGLLYPTQGNLFFKGKNIHDDLTWFRDYVGYVPQDTFLLNDTLFNNITFGRENRKNYDIHELLSLCGADDFMTTNSLSLDTVIGERGNKLSGGQKQRIALCRALYNHPELLIIDEGTSNLDSESESMILAGIRNKFPNIIVILISHRLSSVKLADEIIVIKNSNVIRENSADDKCTENSEFYKIFANQINSNI